MANDSWHDFIWETVVIKSDKIFRRVTGGYLPDHINIHFLSKKPEPSVRFSGKLVFGYWERASNECIELRQSVTFGNVIG